MGGAVKSTAQKVTGAVQQVVGGAAKAANTLVGNKEAAAAAPAAPATPVAPAAAPAPALAPEPEVTMQRRKRGRASSLLATDSTSAPQTASKALLGQ